MVHWLFGLFIILGSTLSAFAITSVNAWMNLPTGFTIVHGKFENVDVWKAMFSETSLVEFFHSMPGYYLAASLAIVGLYGFKLLRSRYKTRLSAQHSQDWLIIQRLMIFATIAFVATIVTADITGKYVAKHEPAKLATIELVNQTTDHSAFVFGGIAGSNGQITGPYIKIPNALSLLAGGSSKTVVTGLNDIPKKEQPPSYIRAIFNLKLTFIGVLVGLVVGYFFLKWWRPQWLAKAIILAPLSLACFLGIVVVEFGWMITEIGRQPWAIRGYVTTAQALTKTHDITSFGYFFPMSYVLLFIVTFFAIKRVLGNTENKQGIR